MTIVPTPRLSQIIWYRKSQSGKLIPGQLSLDIPVILAGRNGAGKSTYLRLLAFLMGVPKTRLRPNPQLQSFTEFYLQDALLLAEFIDHHPHTYLFAGTSRGTQVLTLQVSLQGVRERVDALLRERGTISALLSQLKKDFVGRIQEMSYEEYAKSRSYQGRFLHALLQEQVSLRQISETLGEFFNEKHRLSKRIEDFRESLKRGLHQATQMKEFRRLLQETFPQLVENVTTPRSKERGFAVQGTAHAVPIPAGSVRALARMLMAAATSRCRCAPHPGQVYSRTHKGRLSL